MRAEDPVAARAFDRLLELVAEDVVGLVCSMVS
jgi:hypothetical protein